VQNLISPEQAERLINASLPSLGDEQVALADARNRILREPVLADRPLPPFDRVMMDGIGIAFSDIECGVRDFIVVATQAAGQPAVRLDQSKACIEVMTGCAVPDGCDCVIPVEKIIIQDGTATLAADYLPRCNQHIHPMGKDCSKGEVLLNVGMQLNAPELTIAASCGYPCLQVAALPKIHIISTGDELVSPDVTPPPHQIRRSHATALRALIEGKNLGIVSDEHLPDDPERIHIGIATALVNYDILILTGGVSMGKFDHVAPVLEKLLGSPKFHGISQRPGKPMAFWAERADDGDAISSEDCKRAIFALPGNPVSVMACAARYLVPALTQIQSGSCPNPEKLPTNGNFRCPSHFTGLVPCVINNGKLHLHSPSNSGNFIDLAGTHGIAELPGKLAGKELLNEPAHFYPWI